MLVREVWAEALMVIELAEDDKLMLVPAIRLALPVIPLSVNAAPLPPPDAPMIEIVLPDKLRVMFDPAAKVTCPVMELSPSTPIGTNAASWLDVFEDQLTFREPAGAAGAVLLKSIRFMRRLR